MKCVHNFKGDSTLAIESVRPVAQNSRQMYRCSCFACDKFTEWYYSLAEARLDALYEDWKERR